MSRPLLENSVNLAAEKRIAAFVTERWHLDGFKKLPISYGLDFALLRNCSPRPIVDCYIETDVDSEIVGYAEAKQRRWTFRNGDGYYLALLKANAARNIRGTTGCKCALTVEFDDGIIRWCFMNLYSPKIIWTGRTDRGYDEDIEPHVIYNWAVFQEFR
jgi:hypothetical protein